MAQQGMVFGVDIATPFTQWMEDDFTPRFKKMHPDDEFAGFIIEPGTSFSPASTALTEVLVFSTTTNHDVFMGLLTNVRHKARYALRAGLDSSTALDNKHLVLPGDFVYDGFIRHRGIPAGGSGVRKEFDVVYVREIADKYIELRGAVVGEVIKVVEWARKNWDSDIGPWKYLDGNLDMLEVYRQAYAEAMAA